MAGGEHAAHRALRVSSHPDGSPRESEGLSRAALLDPHGRADRRETVARGDCAARRRRRLLLGLVAPPGRGLLRPSPARRVARRAVGLCAREHDVRDPAAVRASRNPRRGPDALARDRGDGRPPARRAERAALPGRARPLRTRPARDSRHAAARGVAALRDRSVALPRAGRGPAAARRLARDRPRAGARAARQVRRRAAAVLARGVAREHAPRARLRGPAGGGGGRDRPLRARPVVERDARLGVAGLPVRVASPRGRARRRAGRALPGLAGPLPLAGVVRARRAGRAAVGAVAPAGARRRARLPLVDVRADARGVHARELRHELQAQLARARLGDSVAAPARGTRPLAGRGVAVGGSGRARRGRRLARGRGTRRGAPRASVPAAARRRRSQRGRTRLEASRRRGGARCREPRRTVTRRLRRRALPGRRAARVPPAEWPAGAVPESRARCLRRLAGPRLDARRERRVRRDEPLPRGARWTPARTRLPRVRTGRSARGARHGASNHGLHLSVGR